MMFERWRYRGRHRRGAWSVATLTAAIERQTWTVNEVFALRDVLVRDYVPAVTVDLWLPCDDGVKPVVGTLVFDTAPRDRSGLTTGALTDLLAPLWRSPLSAVDDDDAQYSERLMKMAGA